MKKWNERKIMRISIDNCLVENSIVSMREPGFGQLSNELIYLDYEIILSDMDFHKLISLHFNQLVKEIKFDEETYGDEISIGLKETGYLTYEEMNEKHIELSFEIIRKYLFTELLQSLFDGNIAIQYLINSIDSIKMHMNSIHLYGKEVKR